MSRGPRPAGLEQGLDLRVQVEVGRGGADGAADPAQRLQGQPRRLLARLGRSAPGLLRQGLPPEPQLLRCKRYASATKRHTAAVRTALGTRLDCNARWLCVSSADSHPSHTT